MPMAKPEVDTGKAPNPSPDSASLVKRLAGPSVTKAGLANDQTDINRIIAEVSKGSKFYENEKRKDKDLTERITKILKIRDEVVKVADIGRTEADVDHLLVELESQRDLSQIVVHVDMDAFYCSVELMHKPDLVGKPFGVGRGVLTTASYEARKYGVRSGMAGFVAKKLCPGLILIPIDFPKYSEMSRKVMAIFRRYDPTMLVAGCDEGYLNITKYCEENKLSAEECVQEIRSTVQAETHLTVSAGIAPNKMLAKICSDRNKPNGQFHLQFESQAIRSFMRNLSIRKLPGVGKVNERLLESIGINTCQDIYTHRAIISLMDKYFGLRFLLGAYLGISSNVVRPHQREERKSIGSERTFNPIDSEHKILEKLDEVAAELEEDMEKHGWAGKTVTLKYKLHTYQVFTRAKSFNRWITKKDDLFNTAKELIKHEFPLKLRLIGLRVTKLKDLRAPEDRGIKRFFESEGHSPSKRQKLVHENVAASVENEDTMPGFHEHEEWSEGQIDDGAEDVDEEDLDPFLEGSNLKPSSKMSRKPPSSSASKPNSKMQETNHDRPLLIHKKADIQAGHAPLKEVHSCPICAKELETDNSGLNEHIDFCLSKGAIMQATTSRSEGKRRAEQEPEY